MNLSWRVKRWLRDKPLVTTALKLRSQQPLMRNPVMGHVGSLQVGIESGIVKGKLTPVYPSKKVHRPLPSSMGIIDPSFKEREIAQLSATYVAEIDHAYVNDTVLLGDGKWLLGDVSYEPGMARSDAGNHSFLRQWWVPRPTTLSSGWGLLSCSWAHRAYYHWILDLLPRLHLLEQAGHWAPGSSRPFLINSARFPFQAETLARFGITTWVETEGRAFEADNMFCPSMPGEMGEVPDWVPSYLRKRLGYVASESMVAPYERIYISRSNAPSRRVKNESEVAAHMERRGFKVILSEKLTFADQVKLFQHARYIVAPHGGGLTNLCFSAPGCRVLELFGAGYVNPCYWTLAEACRHQYAYLIETGPRQFLLDGAGVSKDYTVDLKRLDESVDVLLSA